jgi:cytochrome oxidase assembly protein ShyY1
MLQLIPVVTPVEKQAEEFIIVSRTYVPFQPPGAA